MHWVGLMNKHESAYGIVRTDMSDSKYCDPFSADQ